MPAYDHKAADRRWVWHQLRQKTPDRWWDLLTDGLNLLEEVRDAVVDLSIATATGVYLDLYGRIVGLTRGAMTDAEYRPAIIVEALSLFGSGEPAHIHRLVRMLVGDLGDIEIVEYDPLAFVLFIPGLSPTVTKLISALLPDVPALTVLGYVVTWEASVVNFASVHGPADVTGWFGSVHGPAADEAGWAHAVPF